MGRIDWEIPGDRKTLGFRRIKYLLTIHISLFSLGTVHSLFFSIFWWGDLAVYIWLSGMCAALAFDVREWRRIRPALEGARLSTANLCFNVAFWLLILPVNALFAPFYWMIVGNIPA